MKKLRVGLIGLGTVGTGVAKLLAAARPPLSARTGAEVELVSIAEIDGKKKPPAPLKSSIVRRDAEGLIDDQNVDAVVELIGGTAPAKAYIMRAIESGKPVVTANKKLLAEHGEEIFAAAAAKKVPVGFEASTAGGIPIIRSLRDGLGVNQIERIVGILNGTTNYILTRMTEEGAEYAAVLAEAQRQGLAEADPSLDVDGVDSAHKLVILARLAFRAPARMADVRVAGIREVTPQDVLDARELGCVIKLLSIAERRGDGVSLRVHPALLPLGHPLAAVGGAYNGIVIRGDAVGRTMFYGLGAGEMPTASAVVSDLVEIARGTALKENPFAPPRGEKPPAVLPPGEIGASYFVRFSVADEFGVIGRIGTALGEHRVSLTSVVQKGPRGEAAVPVIMRTYAAREADLLAALADIDRLAFTRAPARLLRAEEGDGDAS